MMKVEAYNFIRRHRFGLLLGVHNSCVLNAMWDIYKSLGLANCKCTYASNYQQILTLLLHLQVYMLS